MDCRSAILVVRYNSLGSTSYSIRYKLLPIAFFSWANSLLIYDNQLFTLSYGIRALKDMPGRKILNMLTAETTISVPSTRVLSDSRIDRINFASVGRDVDNLMKGYYLISYEPPAAPFRRDKRDRRRFVFPEFRADEVRSPALRTYSSGDRFRTLAMFYIVDDKAIASSDISYYP